MVVILTQGDITKRDYIYDYYTLREAMPYYKECARNVTFREVVLAFILGEHYKAYGEDKDNQDTGLGGYCKGKYIENCKRTFGNALEKVCKSCPN